MRKPGDVTLTAIITADELIIREARYAGIDGPIGTLALPASTDAADAALEGARYQRITPWAIRTGYAGITLEATLIRN